MTSEVVAQLERSYVHGRWRSTGHQDIGLAPVASVAVHVTL